uniref:Uncharacterized protein n=1 Tax=Alexandrium catenella TaxID=2925 RepID=A0A7S1WAZ9_ALECA
MQRQLGSPSSSFSSHSKAVAAGIPSGLAGARQRCASAPTRHVLSAADGRDVRSCLKDRGPNRVAPWNPGIRFRGTDSLASFHIIDQDMPPDARLSMRLNSSAWGDQTIHPRLLQKLPRLSETIDVAPATSAGRAQRPAAAGTKHR